MRKTYKNALMWALYGVLFLFMTVFQTVTFGRMRLFGVKLSLIPVTAACIAMHVGGESGAIFGLAAGLFWCLAGGGGRCDPYCAVGALRRGCGLRVRPVSAAQSALGAADEPWLSDFLSGRVVFGAGISGPCGIRRGPAARAAADRAFAAGGAAGVSGRLVDQKGRGINAAKNALPHDRVHLLHRGDDGGVRAAAL